MYLLVEVVVVWELAENCCGQSTGTVWEPRGRTSAIGGHYWRNVRTFCICHSELQTMQINEMLLLLVADICKSPINLVTKPKPCLQSHHKHDNMLMYSSVFLAWDLL
jgi:hypothetical protein